MLNRLRRCPSPQRLLDYARRHAGVWVARHVQRCPKCRQELERLYREEELVALWADRADDVDEATRTRLLLRCREIAREVGAERLGDRPPVRTRGNGRDRASASQGGSTAS